MNGPRQLLRLSAYAALTYPFVCVPFLYFHFRTFGVSVAEYHWLIASYYLAMVVAEVPTGILADRFGKTLALGIGPLVLGLGYLLLARGESFLVFCAGQIVLGLGHSIISGPPSALLFDTLAADGREAEFLRIESRMHAIRLLGTAVAFLLGGWIVHAAGIVPAIWATIALHGLGSLVALGLRDTRPPAGTATRTGILAAILSAARADVRQPAVLWICAYFVLLFFLLRYCFHTYQPFLEAAKATEPLFVGGLYCALNVLAAPCARLGAYWSERFGAAFVFWLMPLALCAALLVMATEVSRLGVLVMLVHQLPLGMHWGLVQSWVNHRIQPHARATVLSFMSFLGRLVFMGSFVGLGALHERRGVASAYLVAGGAGLVATVACLTLGRRHLAERRA